MRLVALALVGSVLLSACVAADEGSRASSAGRTSPTPGESAWTDSAEWQEASWGPLAVVPPAEGALEAGPYKGTLRITEECVFLEDHPNEVLLWHAGRTRWNGQNRTITIHNLGGSSVTVADGDHVSMGGGSDHYDSFQELVEKNEWISAPSPACQADEIWVVSSLVKD